ncbi:MAG: hypothetical protein KatS3mg065_0210 [Chloroflexota bacterium]|nr:MAG: hypothetical protein KatS3mg065_0210 [Chloroflexota bacterium]
MTPTRPSPPARRTLLVVLVAVPLLVAACGATRSPDGSAPASPPVSGQPTREPSPAASPSSPPVASPSDAASPAPTPSEPAPSESAPSLPVTPTPLPNPDPAAVCSGSDRNRDFYAAVAEAVDWDVYCPVLPSGWYVDRGTYRLASGGRLEIAYTGPAEARLEIREGAFCTEAGGCVPSGTDRGEAAFGDRTGTLIELDGGGWAIVVDRGARISWLAVGEGLTVTEFVDLVARFALVDA